MKAFVHNGYGSVDALELVEVKTPAPADHEVLVQVVATAINDWEWGMLRAPWFVRLAIGWRRPRGKFRIMGCDVAGRVAAVGDRVRSFAPGDEVYGDLSGYRFGAFAEYVCVGERHLRRKPASRSFCEAAAIPHAAELALQAIQTAPELEPGQQVLVNGAGGGVGALAIQLLERHGVDRAAKLDHLRSLGYAHLIPWPEQDFTRTVQQYDLIIDTKTSASALDYLRALRADGTYVTVGGDRVFAFMALAPLVNPFTRKHLRTVALQPNRNLTEITELFASGRLQPTIDGVYRSEQIPEAMERFREGTHTGKIVIEVAAGD